MLRQSVSITALVLALTACGEAPETRQAAEIAGAESLVQDQNLLIQTFFEKAMQARLAYNPLLAERLGDRRRNDSWPDLSDDTADEVRVLMQAQLAQARAFEPETLNEANRLSQRLFAIDTERAITLDDWRDYGYPVNQMYGWHTLVPTHLMTVHRIDTVADAEAYIVRLEKVGALMAQVVAQMSARQAKGILPPRFVFPKVISAARNVISGAPFDGAGTTPGGDDAAGEDGAGNDAESLDTENGAGAREAEDTLLFADFKRKIASLNLSEQETVRLQLRAQAALLTGVKPGYEALIAELERQEALATTDDGVWKFPDGENFYAGALAYHTTTDLTADEIHVLGLSNVERIHGEMQAIMDKVGFEGTLAEFFDFTRTDEQFFFENTEEGKARYLERARNIIEAMQARVPDYFDLIPKAPMEVRAVEAFREQSAGKAFYQRAAPDGSRPGIFYANLRNMADMPLYQLEALAYHEGIPGHHFQIALAQELEGVPLFQRTARFTAFSEGWGLYTEELGKDMGFYQDPYSDFGRLAMELWRACRLVVDTGIHARKWTREQAIQYLVDNTPNPEGDAIAAIERYIVLPGQATAYMVGKLKIMELRNRAMNRLGGRFDFRGFHRAVLGSGFVPLSVLEENVNAWIAEQS
ncbi:DUF885 domain-containing protein [Eilatimonas milleporae]|uniref:Uncharacterized protein (DUF885 family) n=1 Tax=Eilatimonas milleporae TaxID=911205 RepID=A0A3M0CY78_9PROT|nr:DUF885 domain-containing protein [Eilatimonas milleporae]RMB08993.1 uncharacterized protein (DUF885 family) [Eilatimonas milleporae]